MRRTVLLGSVLLPVALVAAGCASEIPRADGPGGPVTPAPTTVAATPSTPPPSTSPTSPSNSPSTSHTPGSGATNTTPTVLGHNGFGALKLGMTSKQALATGLIDPWKGTEKASCSLYSHLKADHAKAGTVILSGSTGVEVIDAWPGLSTTEGIHIGSTKAQMLRAYPGWKNTEPGDPHADGIGFVDFPGNSKATYRIQTRSGKVVDVTLQLNAQNCYE